VSVLVGHPECHFQTRSHASLKSVIKNVENFKQDIDILLFRVLTSDGFCVDYRNLIKGSAVVTKR
jgi:hypothetical protein